MHVENAKKRIKIKCGEIVVHLKKKKKLRG